MKNDLYKKGRAPKKSEAVAPQAQLILDCLAEPTERGALVDALAVLLVAAGQKIAATTCLSFYKKKLEDAGFIKVTKGQTKAAANAIAKKAAAKERSASKRAAKKAANKTDEQANDEKCDGSG